MSAVVVLPDGQACRVCVNKAFAALLPDPGDTHHTGALSLLKQVCTHQMWLAQHLDLGVDLVRMEVGQGS